MTTLTEPRRPGAFIISEASGTRSREAIVINAGAGRLAAGTVLGVITAANTATATAAGTNTGQATIGTVTASNNSISGTYGVVITAAGDGSTPAKFTVTDPNGATDTGKAGTKFDGLGISFTLTDGTNPNQAAADDSYTIAVTEGQGEYTAYDPIGTNDGRRAAVGILYAPVDATTHDVKAAAIVRDAEVDAAELTGLDSTATAALKALGIIVRGA